MGFFNRSKVQGIKVMPILEEEDEEDKSADTVENKMIEVS